MTSPGASRGQPAFDQTAQDVIAATRGQPRYIRPDFYEPAAITAEDKAEGEKAKDRICGLCAGVHPLPGTAACPRLVSVELDGDGKIKAATFRTDQKWQSRVVLAEDLAEEGEPDGG